MKRVVARLLIQEEQAELLKIRKRLAWGVRRITEYTRVSRDETVISQALQRRLSFV
jgi:hypothetical protein